MLAVPSIILTLAAGVMGGLAISAQRLGWLISLHHHIAAAPVTGNNPPKTVAFRKARRLMPPNVRTGKLNRNCRFGQKRTCNAQADVRFIPKADMVLPIRSPRQLWRATTAEC